MLDRFRKMEILFETVVIVLVLALRCQAQPAQVIYHVTEENQTQTLIGNAYVDSGLSSRMKQTSNVQFGFVSPTPQTKYFRMEHWSGAIHTTEALDRETICADNTCPVNLDVAVQLVTGASRDLVAIIRVEVFIDDINDNAPEFLPASASLSIVESTPVDTTIGLYAASDSDIAGNNSVITYQLQPPNGFGKFDMKIVKNWDGSTDVGLVLSKQLDREVQAFYQVRIIARDGGKPSLTGTLTIDITVTDSNDHIPVFTKPVYNVTIWENVTMGTEILRLSTNDQDIGLNGQVTYRFNPRSAAKIGSVFKIGARTGAVTVNGPVDFETSPVYQLIVEASDSGVPPKSSQSTVVIHVQDVNDNPPEIAFNLLAGGDHAIVSEFAKPGSFVAHISVSDGDVAADNKIIDCHIQDALFDLEKLSNQEFKVILSGAVDRERMDEYRVDVSCQDFGTPRLEATTPLRVVIKDENDHDPYFTKSLYSKSLVENFALGKAILTVSAKDGDIGKNGEISFQFGDGDHRNLTIHPSSGVISATGYLDREQTPVIQCQVLALDNGKPRRTATASLTLTLVDVNDELPNFPKTAYKFHVFENRPTDSSVGTVEAVDPDLDEGGLVYYTILKNSVFQGEFNISRSGGLISTNKVFDRESKSQYRIVVVAYDRGAPSLTSFIDVTIDIEDENDHFPIITYPTDLNNTVDILHSTDVNSLVAHVRAYDLDANINSQLSYFIESGNTKRFLKINEQNGQIRIADRIRSYQCGTYELVLGVRDKGTPMKSSWKSFILNVNLDNTTALEIMEEEGSGNIVIVVSVITATVILSLAIIIGIIVIRRQDAKKHIYRAKSEERKIIRRRGSVNSKSDQSNTSTNSDQSKKDVSLTLTDDSQAPLNASTFTQVTSFSTFKGQMLSYISSIDQKTLECPQACSSWITTNTISPDLKRDTIGDKQAEINKLAYEQEHQPAPVSHSDRAYLQIIHEETESKSMLKSLNDTLSDVSSETMVTSDSGRGGSEEDVHYKSTVPENVHLTSGNQRPLSTFGNYQQRRSYHGGQYGESYGRFPPVPPSEYHYSPKISNCNGVDYEKNINVSEGSIIDNTTVRMSDAPPPRPPRLSYHNTPSQQIVDVPSCLQSNIPSTQDTHQQLGFLSRLHIKSPSAQMCSPSLVGKTSYYNNRDPFSSITNKTTNMYDATTASERCGLPYSVGDIDDGVSDCTTDMKDDDATTTTSGSYTINPDDLCNEIDELFFRDVIV